MEKGKEKKIQTLKKGDAPVLSSNDKSEKINTQQELAKEAGWFAKRFNLTDPAVFTITVPHSSIMACTMDRNEAEYLVKLPLPTKPKRLKVLPEPSIQK